MVTSIASGSSDRRSGRKTAGCIPNQREIPSSVVGPYARRNRRTSSRLASSGSTRGHVRIHVSARTNVTFGPTDGPKHILPMYMSGASS